MSTMISARRDRALWIQCACTALVAPGAAYASYRHGRAFALRFGADESTANIWPLIVDGLLTVATVELWKTGRGRHAAGRWAAWLAFVFGICLSLCANIAAARELSVFSVVVAACPLLVLLLAVELLNHALKRHHAEVMDETADEIDGTDTAMNETASELHLEPAPAGSLPPAEPSACARTTWPSSRRGAHQLEQNSIGSQARTTTAARCYDGGKRRAERRLRSNDNVHGPHALGCRHEPG